MIMRTMAGKLFVKINRYCCRHFRLSTQWERLTTLHRAFVLSGLVFLFSSVVTLPGLLSIYFLSILSALAVAKILNESNCFQPSDSLLKYVYFLVNFYLRNVADLSKYWKKGDNTLVDGNTLHQPKTFSIEVTYKPSSHSLPDITDSEKQLSSLTNEEVQFRDLILNNFIMSWYTTLSQHQQVPNEFLCHIKFLFKIFKNHSKQLDVHGTVNHILFELRKHVKQFRISSLKLKQLPLNSHSTLAEVYGHCFKIHEATQNQKFMEDYLRQVANLLMWFLMPGEMYNCYAGNLLMQEILTCNVFVSLVDLLSDPDTFNDIIHLLMDDQLKITSREQIKNAPKEENLTDVSNLKAKVKANDKEKVGVNTLGLLVEKKDKKREEFTNDSSDSDDQKVMQTSLVRSKGSDYLDLNDSNIIKTGSLPDSKHIICSPTKPLCRSKSSPILTQLDQSAPQEKIKVLPMTQLVQSSPFKKVPSLTSLVSFRSIPPDEDDSELWFLDGEDNLQDGYVITKDPCPYDDQLVLYNTYKHDAGFASDTMKMLHGMVDSALSKLPSMESNVTEDNGERDGVLSNLMENIKNWKTSIEDEVEVQFLDYEQPSNKISVPDELSSNGITLQEDDHSNWGHDFVNEQQKKLPSSILEIQNKETMHQNAKHSNSVDTFLQFYDEPVLSQNSAVKCVDSESHRAQAVVEGLPTEDPDLNKERSVWIQSMLIVDTETMKDQRNITKDYTLYIIKYQALVWKGQEHPKKPETHWLKRRFREFTNLQSRLEENPHLKPLLKGIKDVPRKLQLVNRMNEDVVLHRKQSLECYLQTLCSIPAICSSIEFQEFIALEGDTHIEFVKKVPELVPRIDKFFLRGVSGIMGTLKSKLPTSSLPANQALVDADHEDSSQVGSIVPEPPSSPFAEVNTYVPQRSYIFRKRNSSMEKNVDVLLKNFLESKGMDVIALANKDHETNDTRPEGINKPMKTVLRSYSEDDRKELNYSEILLADSIMCLLCEVLHDNGNWIIKETTQQIIAVTFGKLINKIIEDTIDELFTESRCANYLQLIREALWPNGKLLSKKVAPKTDEEKEQSRNIAFQRVKDIMPSIFTHGVGNEELDDCLAFLHASLQDPTLNRHLVFTLIDILIDALLPTIQDHYIQEKIIEEAVF